MKGNEGGHTEDLLETQYLEAPNRAEIDYTRPLAQLTSECVELRDTFGISQTQLAERMNTKQSVISRFENLDGRLPSYDFIARLSAALGHSPGMTLYGDWTGYGATLTPRRGQGFGRERGSLNAEIRYCDARTGTAVSSNTRGHV